MIESGHGNLPFWTLPERITALIKSLFSRVVKQHDLPYQLAILAVLLAGGWFRFFQIGKLPLWADEGFSVWMASQPVSDLIEYTIRIDQHPPLYNLLLHFWQLAGGTSEAWVRSLSAVFSTLTLIPVYFLGKTLSNRATGLIAALLLAVSPFNVQYAQEARAYAMLGFFAAMAMWMAARLLVDERAHTQRIGQQVRGCLSAKLKAVPHGLKTDACFTDRSWLGFIVFTALTVYSHNTAILLPFAINLFVLGLMVFRRFVPAGDNQLQPPTLRNWVLAHFGILLLWGPWLPGFLIQAQGVMGEFWIPRPTFATVQAAVKAILLGWLPERLEWRWVIWAGLAFLFALALVRYRRAPGRFAFLALLAAAPFVGELLVSLKQPVFSEQTLIWSTVPAAVLLAVGVSRLRYRSYIVTAVILLGTLSWLSLNNYSDYAEKERWDLAAAYVGEAVQPGDIILFNSGWLQIPFDYYFARFNAEVEEFGVPATLFERGTLEPRMIREDIPRLETLLRGRARVWLVYSHHWWTDPSGLIPQVLEERMHPAGSRIFNGIEVYLYELTEETPR